MSTSRLSEKQVIMNIDDDEDSRRLIQQILVKNGYEAITAESGKEALGLIDALKPDLIFMDVQMPVMDGYTATQHIRSYEKEKGMTPAAIVALTANAIKEDEQKSISAGCDGHLTKPIKKQELLLALQKYRPKQDLSHS